MPRHKRHSELRAAEERRLVEASAEFFHALQRLMCNLRPTDHHYRRLSNLTREVNETVEDLTGEPPRWTRR